MGFKPYRQTSTTANPTYPSILEYGNMAIANNGVPAFGDKNNKYVELIPAPKGLTTKFGDGALLSLTTGTNNTAFGADALSKNTSGYNNTAIGVEALGRNTGGANNVAIGCRALSDNTSSSNNIAIGYDALLANTAANNIAIGYMALRPNGAGTSNIAIGTLALSSNTSGYYNCAIGTNAGINTNGNLNTFIGRDSGYANAGGERNTFIGAYSGRYSQGGNGNTCLGYYAGYEITEGANNIIIGASAVGTSSDTGVIRIGTSNNSTCYINGIYGRTASSGISVLINSSHLLGTTTSSRRFKKNIENIEDKYVDNFFANARSVWYQSTCEMDNPDYGWWGFIAEELAEIDPRLVYFGYFDEDYEMVTKTRMVPNPDYKEGGDEPKEIEEKYEEKELKEGAVESPRAVYYDRITVLLTHKVQSQQEMIDDLIERLEDLENERRN